MSGYLNNFEQQISTLNSVYYELLAPIEKQSTLKNWWVFGGGTALAMFHFNHRKSFDIDIFITESQLFDFLNPKWYIDETNLFDSNEYRFDGINHHVQLKTKATCGNSLEGPMHNERLIYAGSRQGIELKWVPSASDCTGPQAGT